MTISTTIPRRVDSASDSPHRFSLGQLVRLTGGFRTPNDVFVITAKLPPNDGSPQYRIRAQNEGFERMAMESNLELAAIPKAEAAFSGK